ncbi:MAG TPA: helix-turn-helix transcriptional regulator [Acidimicrobiales bacterium]|nr:helix-turn-helix transcriptional regulator [Acidimicrobiales bacterium]
MWSTADMVVLMTVHNARELGAALRSQRVSLGWTQEELATKVGVSRDWVIGLERGTSNPTINLLLRTLTLLGLDLAVEPAGTATPTTAGAVTDLDTLLSGYRR